MIFDVEHLVETLFLQILNDERTTLVYHKYNPNVPFQIQSFALSVVTAKENSSPSNSSETAHMRSYLNPRPLSPELPPRRARGRGLGITVRREISYE